MKKFRGAVRRLTREAGHAAVRGAATTAGSALCAAVVWWVTHR